MGLGCLLAARPYQLAEHKKLDQDLGIEVANLRPGRAAGPPGLAITAAKSEE